MLYSVLSIILFIILLYLCLLVCIGRIKDPALLRKVLSR